MNKILCIVGSTGTGKTSKAIELSTQQPSVIISADSRQVYREMDIVTGKDHPIEIMVHGLNIVDPDEACSVAVWYDHVKPIIQEAWKNNKLPIIVGGTGLYIKALTSGIETMSIPINQTLRNSLIPLSITELQSQLKQLNNSKYESLNHSDVNNPRRLMRAIEIESHKKSSPKSNPINHEIPDSSLIGYKYTDDTIYQNIISSRINSRIKQGAIEETEKLLSKYNPTLPSMTALGYKSIIKYLRGDFTYDQMVADWLIGEFNYAKRQMTWFRKQPVIWYDK